MSDCIFCRIVDGEIPADIVYQDDEIVAFNDVNPQAPTHVLVIPRKHIGTLLDVEDEDTALLGQLQRAAV